MTNLDRNIDPMAQILATCPPWPHDGGTRLATTGSSDKRADPLTG